MDRDAGRAGLVGYLSYRGPVCVSLEPGYTQDRSLGTAGGYQATTEEYNI